MGKDGYDRCSSLRKKMLKVSRKVAVLFRKRQGRFYKKTLNFSPKDGEDFLKSWPTFSKKIPKISGKDTVLFSSFRYKGKSIWGKALVENEKGTGCSIDNF